MLAGDALRFAPQAALAAALLTGPTPMWAFLCAATVLGIGEGLVTPALRALIPHIVTSGRRHEGKLQDANTLAGLAESPADVCGPALAGVVVVTAGPGVAVAFDAGSYAVSVFALAALRLRRDCTPVTRVPSMLAGLREGWSQFRERTWMWAITLQFALFNLLVWAPFLVLGPVAAQRHLGGANAWGLIMTSYGIGGVLGGLALMGRRPPRRPLVVATIATFGWALPSGAIALSLPTACIITAALLAGGGCAVDSALSATVNQEQVPTAVLGRTSSIGALGAFVLGPTGLAGAGHAAAAVGITAVLGFGALWQVVASSVVLAVPDVRRLRSRRCQG